MFVNGTVSAKGNQIISCNISQKARFDSLEGCESSLSPNISHNQVNASTDCNLDSANFNQNGCTAVDFIIRNSAPSPARTSNSWALSHSKTFI
jgi:hypothetical protein